MKTLVLGAAIAATIALAPSAFAQDATPHGYMIANYDIKDQATFQKYMDAAGSLASKYHGKVIVFDTKANAVEGHPRSVIAIAEFPSLADARRFYDSPEYTAARKFRIAATEGSVIVTEGFARPKD